MKLTRIASIERFAVAYMLFFSAKSTASFKETITFLIPSTFQLLYRNLVIELESLRRLDKYFDSWIKSRS